MKIKRDPSSHRVYWMPVFMPDRPVFIHCAGGFSAFSDAMFPAMESVFKLHGITLEKVE